jgi:hypothetical protein
LRVCRLRGDNRNRCDSRNKAHAQEDLGEFGHLFLRLFFILDG